MKPTFIHSLIQRHPSVAFFMLSYAFAWAVWIPVGIFAPAGATLLIRFGAWAPTIAALVLTALLDGRAGVCSLVRGVLKWRVGWGWYVVAVFGITIVALGAISVHVLLGGTAPSLATIAAGFGLARQNSTLLFALLPFIFVTTIFIGGPIAEELGWRGYAQSHLQERIGAVRASLLIGVLWALWHLPLFFFAPSNTANIPFAWYVPLVTALSVLFGSLYNRTGGSVLLCILFHTGFNFAVGALGLVNNEPQLLAIFVTLMCVAALGVGLTMRPMVGKLAS